MLTARFFAFYPFLMFVRVKTRANGKRSVQICESYRRSDKVSQKVVRHVGQAINDKEEAVLKKLANSIIVEMKNSRTPVLPIFSPEQFYDPELKRTPPPKEKKVNLMALKEEQRIIMGIGDVFGKLYRDLSFDSIITGTKKNQQWNALLKLCVIARLANPSSKRKTASFLEQDYGIKAPLEKIYRLMDHVSTHEDKIKDMIALSTLSLFGDKLNVLFFDVTTLYFESIQDDELKNFGFSKDCKFKEVQVVLSLITTDYGMPISYEVFSGNTFEGNTLIKTLREVGDKYNTENITVVADRGMFSEKNLEALEKENIKYIVGAKLKTMGKKKREEILDDNGYRGCIISDEFYWSKEIEYKKRRLIVSYSSKRARKDAKDRQRLVDRLMKKVKDGKLKIKDVIPNYGTKKYLKVEGGSASINLEKVNSDAEWDGLYGIISNSKEDYTELIERYRGLWQIEESFRVSKHDLKMRPIFHWKPERVKAHIAICFLAYTLAKQAIYRLHNQAGLKISLEQLKNELLHAQSSVIMDTDNGAKYLLPSKTTVNQKKIYSAFGIARSDMPEELVSVTVNP